MGNPIRCVTINAVSPIKETADALHARSTVPVGFRPCILFRLGRLAEGEMAKPRLFDKLDHFKRTPDIVFTPATSAKSLNAMVPLCANAAVQNGGANGERLSLLRRKIRNAAFSKRLSCLLHETLLGPGNRQLVAHPRATIL